MNKIKAIEIKNLKLSSTVFPTAEDLALWHSLSEDKRFVIIERDEEEAYQSKTSLIISKEKSFSERGQLHQ